MKKLALILFAALCLSVLAHADTEMYEEIHGNGLYSVSQEDHANRRLEAYKKEFMKEGLLGFAERTDEAMNAVIRVSVMNLKRKGFSTTAREIEHEWNYKHRGTVQRLVLKQNRDIGDFKPLSEWLAKTYEKIEAALTYEVCRALRISDLKTFNYAIPVVFAPCSVNEMQFELHFIHDAKYRGLFPVVVYWVSSITCSMATFGAGYFFICSPIATLIEMGADRWLAPWLAPKIWEAFCGSNQ